MQYLLLKDQQGELDLIDTFDSLDLAISAFNTIGADLANEANCDFKPYVADDPNDFIKAKAAFAKHANGTRKAFAILELKINNNY